MATVGINFGSVNSGQGFDVASTVGSLLGIQQAIETPWKNQLTTLKAQDTVFSTIGKDLSTLTTSLQALTDFSGVMTQKQGSSSDQNVLGLSSASTSAVAGTHTVVVNSLAQTSSQYSTTVKNAGDTLSGTVTIQVGSGASTTITVDSSSNTLDTLAKAINLAGIGATASVISDASGSRLSLVSGTGGSAGQLAITGTLSDSSTASTLGFQTGQIGVDASLTVDGVALTSAVNKVSTAISGVSFQLLAAAPNNPIQVVIANDNSAVTSAFSSFVTAYNAVVKDVSGQEANDSNGNPQPLYGSPTLAFIQSRLSGALLMGAASGSISNVMQLGLSLNNDGTLSLDANVLNSALDSNFSDVTGFLQNSGSFGQTLGSTLNSLGVDSTNSAISLAQQQNASQEAALNGSIGEQDARVAAQKTILTNELNAANQILQSIPSQLNQVNEIYSAITGFNQMR